MLYYVTNWLLDELIIFDFVAYVLYTFDMHITGGDIIISNLWTI